jgi:hypothetical protein
MYKINLLINGELECDDKEIANYGVGDVSRTDKKLKVGLIHHSNA